MVKTADEIFRDHTTEGVPSSGAWEPYKPDIREWGRHIEYLSVAITTAGGKIYATKLTMQADLTPAANTPAIVLNDGTPANNGLYRKVGGPGTGSWALELALVPGYQFIKAVDAGAGTANAIVATSSIPVPDTANIALMQMAVFEANTGATTLAINGGSARPVVTNDGNPLQSGYFSAGRTVLFVFDGTNYRLLTDVVASAIVSAAEALLEDMQELFLGGHANDAAATAAAGGSPTTGATYYDTSLAILKVWGGSSWGAIAATNNFTVDTFAGDGVEDTFTLSGTPGSSLATFVFISGVHQYGGSDGAYSVTGNQLVFSAPPPANGKSPPEDKNIVVLFGSAVGVAEPADGSVTTNKMTNNAVTYAKMQDISATSRVLGRKTAGAGDPEELTLSEVLDFIGSAARGDILFRGASAWQRLAAGTSGQFLKTNGAGADPAWAGGATGFTSIVIQTFTSDGTYTPTSGMQFCLVEAVGGGGGSGGAKSTAGQFSCGGGGGAGEWVQSRLTAAAIGASKAVAIGAGGTAGTATPGSGGNGGDTTLGTTLVVAKGGTGGVLGNTSNGGAGGAGGTGGTGDVKVNGEAGGPGSYGAIITIAAITGKGGNSRMGPGGAQVYRANTGVGSGQSGNGPGGGASGTAEFNASVGGAGAAGAAGKMVIIEFI